MPQYRIRIQETRLHDVTVNAVGLCTAVDKAKKELFRAQDRKNDKDKYLVKHNDTAPIDIYDIIKAERL